MILIHAYFDVLNITHAQSIKRNPTIHKNNMNY
jgi:hypothetical protein